jgi:hypothetical protein
MGPATEPDGHDFPRLIDKLVPSLTAESDDLGVGFEKYASGLTDLEPRLIGMGVFA